MYTVTKLQTFLSVTLLFMRTINSQHLVAIVVRFIRSNSENYFTIAIPQENPSVHLKIPQPEGGHFPNGGGGFQQKIGSSVLESDLSLSSFEAYIICMLK